MAYAVKSDGKHRDNNGVLKFKFKGMFRDSGDRLLAVKDANEKVMWYWRKGDAVSAANEAEIKARRAAPTVANTSGSVTYGEWFEQTSDGNRHPHSDGDDDEQRIMRKIVLPKWGETPLNGIGGKAIKAWIKDDLTPKYAPRYVAKIYYAFKVWINLAMDADILTATPCGPRMGLPTIHKQSRSYFEFGDIEMYRALGFREDYLRVVEFGFETGMRPSEVSGLHVKWVKLDSGWLQVADVLVPGKMSIRSWPKTKEPRLVPLTHRARGLVGEGTGDRDLTAGCGLPHFSGATCDGELIFRSKLGEVITARNVSQALRLFQNKHGLPHKSSYSARRAFATWAIENGLDPATVQKIMGHSNLDQTFDYHQITPAAQARLEEAAAMAKRQPSAVAESVANLRRMPTEEVVKLLGQHAA